MTSTDTNPETAVHRQMIDRLARILHESGREAVNQRKIYRSDLPVKPFAEWDELDENTKDGRRLMAQYLRDHSNEVSECLAPIVLE